MKKTWFFRIIPVLIALSSPLLGQTPPGASPAPPSTNKEDENSGGKTFKPHWENELGLNYSNQQAGQTTRSLSYTGSHLFDEEGSFLSGELELSQQKVEGVLSKTGTFTATGGLDLGFFSPSLAIGYQGGESALSLLSGDLILDFPIGDPFSVTLCLGGNAGSHQGDVSAFYPSLTGPVRIDTAAWSSSLGMAFIPWDWWTISLTAQNEYDITYQLQSTAGKAAKKVPVNQADHVSSLALGLDFILFKGFVLGLSPQVGQEYFPAGLVYSPKAGGLVNSTAASTQNFAGGTVSITYLFE